MAAPAPPLQSWFVISAGDEAKFDIFRTVPELGTRHLYGIDPADKAMAVPTIRIWKLEGGPTKRTNKKVDPKNPLSDQFTAVPAFGSPGRFAERPAASLESVTVKKVNPGGWIMFREIDIALVVHRPDVLNSTRRDGNVVNALLQPGNSFVMEYGWIGGRNAILGPGAHRKEDERELTPGETAKLSAAKRERAEAGGIGQVSAASAVLAHRLSDDIARKRPPPALPEFFGTVFTAVQSVRFSVVNYSFTILPDNQLKFMIHCVEDGELEIRNTTIFEQPDLPQPTSSDPSAAGAYLDAISDYFSAKLRDLSFPESIAADDPKGVAGQTKPSEEEFIEFQDVLNVLFAMPLVRAVAGLGYSHVHLYTGVFNAYAPRTNESLGAREWASRPIGNFWLKLKDVQKTMSDIVHSKQQITVYNMLITFLGQISDPNIWVLDPRGTSMPEMQVFTLFDPKSGYARIQIVDRKRYLTVLRGVDGLNEVNLTDKKAGIARNLGSFLAANHMPRFVLGHQSSFFKDAKFDVVNDELMKSIFMNRQIKRTREQITAGDARQIDNASGIPQGLMIYQSAVKGQVTVIGNFVYDLLGQVWVSFGIPALDGIFYILSKVDRVDRDGFYSTLSLQAEGSNPLGSGAARPLVAEDFAKTEIARLQLTDFIKSLTQPTARVPPADAAALEASLQQTLTEDALQARLPANQSREPPPFSSPGATKDGLLP